MKSTLEQLHAHQHYRPHQHQMDGMLPLANEANSGARIDYDHSHHMGGHDGGGLQLDEPLSGPMGTMRMYFHSGPGDLVLFRGCLLDSSAKLWLAAGLLFLGALLLEMIDYSRGYLSCRCGVGGPRAQPPSGRRPKSTSETGLVGAGGAKPPPAAAASWDCCADGESADPEADAHGDGGARLQTAPPVRPLHAYGAADWRKGHFEPAFFPVRAHGEPRSLRLVQAALQFVRTGLSLCLMLAAMTYNVCLIFAILLGSAVGFYVFYRPALEPKSALCH